MLLPPADPDSPGDDPFAPAGGEMALTRLAEQRWVQYAPDHALADVLDTACEAEGFRPRVAVRTEQTAMAPLLTAAGIGPGAADGLVELTPAMLAHRLQQLPARPEPRP